MISVLFKIGQLGRLGQIGRKEIMNSIISTLFKTEKIMQKKEIPQVHIKLSQDLNYTGEEYQPASLPLQEYKRLMGKFIKKKVDAHFNAFDTNREVLNNDDQFVGEPIPTEV
jgi:hypothetical protein